MEETIMRKSLFIGLVAILSLFGCSRNQEIDVPDANFSIFARTESPADTKTVVESGVHVFWEPGDEIAVFTGEQSAKFTTDITAASGTAIFKGTFGDTTWPEDLDLWAVYPFSEDALFDGETITTTLPSEQVAREGSFGKDMNLAIAHSNSSTLQFYNVGGGIRFSVTEEGIRKVMFEGLSGEIISGKVKIGLDESGKPIVQEVTGGSQFITLLPPTGKETFEPGAWYYIVAIPGALEGGYKLRFYKDSDYARKVSEKKVQIKRSVFGNVEKADEGIEYEVRTTHFPQTKDEISESVQLTNEIGAKITQLIDDLHEEPSEQDISAFDKIEGVESVVWNDAQTTLSLMQKDSVWLNVHFKVEKGIPFTENTHQSNRSNLHKQLSKRNQLNNNSPNRDKLALILAPFQSSFDTDIDGIKEDLLFAGFREENIHYFPDDQADILKFRKDFLSQYSFILIRTHGGTSYRARSTGDDGYGVKHQTTLASYTFYSAEAAQHYIDSGELKWSEIALGTIDNGKTWRFEMTPRFIYDTSFDNTCVLLGGCETAEILDEGRGNGSMIWQFIDDGAGVVSGNRHSINTYVSNPCMEKTIKFLAHGLSFKETYDYLTQSKRMTEQNNRAYLTLHNYAPDEYSDALEFDIPLLYTYRQKDESSPYFLIDPHPILVDNKEDHYVGETITLSWNCNLDDFTDKWIYYTKIEDDFIYGDQEEVSFSVKYDIYLKGSYYATREEKSIQLTPTNAIDATWFVIAKIMEGDTVIASYQSQQGNLTVKEQIPAPPQVETFPASVDAQKAFLSGMVTNRSLEGLETGFYYYKLTAQEESTELSASEKERLVMGGKKVLSTGDYKDYFGIDLTDIEQDSKYLFVAYATDEYSQTGKGEVLSFTTGSPSVHVSSVSLNMSSLELGVGNTATLVATVLPENASNKKVTWSSSDESRATVSSQGVVKGISMGNAVITVTTEDGGKTAQCHVSVTQSTVHVQSVSLNKTDLVLTVGNSETLIATVLPENASNKSVTWSSSNPSKAKVSSTGVVTGVEEGSAVVTATTVDGGKTASCFVTVRQATQPDPEPRLSVSTNRLDFGNQIKFTQKTRDITITNAGTGTLQITSISKTNNYGDLFQLSGWTSGGSIAAGASKTITVSFQPIEEKYYEETLTIVSSNSVGSNKATVTLCGTGISEPENALIQIVGDELTWGDVEIGESVPKSFTVKNTGTTALNISSIKIVATDNTVNPSYFSITPDNSCTISPGKSKDFIVSFIPEAVRSYNAIVSIKSNASNATQGTSTVWLSGNGIKATSKVLTASPSSLSFGYQTIGNRTHKNFTVTNTGTKAVTLYSMEATDGFIVDQTWAEGNTLGLAAGASKTFSAYFAPTEVKSYSGKITIKSNSSSGDLVIPLSGIGEEEQGYLEITSGERLDFGNVNLGTSGTLTTRIRNTGEAPLSILGINCPDGFTASCSVSSLKEGYNASITVSFTPTSAKYYSGSIVVYTDAENESISIEVSGTGIKSSTSSTFVDMGLSVKWASANVGASKPEDYGHYVAWAETATKTQYLYNNYKYYNGDAYFSGSGFITKYCQSPDIYGYQGYSDYLRMLTYEDDYAQAKYGGLARIPTRKEWEELKKNCSWTWTSQSGINGYLVTSNINGNSIFLPAAGSIEYSNTEVNSVGYYWASNLEHDETYATTWELRSDKAWYSYRERYKGLTVRAVEDYTPKPMIEVSGNLNFGGVKLGTTARKTITIHNTGKGTLHITEVRSTSRIGLEWTSASIEPGASKTLTVYYTPKNDPNLVIEDPETWDMTTVAITSDARNESDFILYVKGYGIANSGNVEGTQEEPWN